MKKPNLIYENYKLPLKHIPKSVGYGYYGTVAQTEDRKLVQCHICGKLFPGVSWHVKYHKISIEDYKERFGLNKTTALVADVVREELQKRVFDNKFKDLPEHLKEYNLKVQNGEIKHPGNKRTAKGQEHLSLEQRNKMGLCPDQVLGKITELRDKLGHTPSNDEFNTEYHGKYISSIRYLHGSYLKAVKKAKLTSAKELKEPSNEKLIQDLVDFNKRFKRIPMTSDFNRGFLYPRSMYWTRFGSLNNARIEAGLNAILPMPFGMLKELTPDEYLAYKKGFKLQEANS